MNRDISKIRSKAREHIIDMFTIVFVSGVVGLSPDISNTANVNPNTLQSPLLVLVNYKLLNYLCASCPNNKT